MTLDLPSRSESAMPCPTRSPVLATARFRARVHQTFSEFENKLKFEQAILPALVQLLGTHEPHQESLPWIQKPAMVYGQSVCLDLKIYDDECLKRLRIATPKGKIDLPQGDIFFPEALLSWRGLELERELVLYPVPDGVPFSTITEAIEQQNLQLTAIKRTTFFYRDGSKQTGLCAPNMLTITAKGDKVPSTITLQDGTRLTVAELSPTYTAQSSLEPEYLAQRRVVQLHHRFNSTAFSPPNKKPQPTETKHTSQDATGPNNQDIPGLHPPEQKARRKRRRRQPKNQETPLTVHRNPYALLASTWATTPNDDQTPPENTETKKMQQQQYQVATQAPPEKMGTPYKQQSLDNTVVEDKQIRTEEGASHSAPKPKGNPTKTTNEYQSEPRAYQTTVDSLERSCPHTEVKIKNPQAPEGNQVPQLIYNAQAAKPNTY